MTSWDRLKQLFWDNRLMTTNQKERVFYFVRSLVKGKVTNNRDSELMHLYINDLLKNQDLTNDFSIDAPETPLINRSLGDPKILAYYLPQYYPDPHNNQWWGKGSTEWTNVSKAVPQYYGHYQPRLPGELGFYDLRVQDNLKRQVELAKYYGIYGFCFYYYWFNGERVLDVPFENFVKDTSINYPFCICWVNESWTRQWSGTSNETLVAVPKEKDVYKRFITDVVRLFNKDNYIKINDKALLVIYRPMDVPACREVTDYWRAYAKKLTGLDLYIMAAINEPNKLTKDLRFDGFDALCEFAPGPQLPFMKNITREKKFVCDNFYGEIYDYKEFVERKGYFNLKNCKLYRAVSPMWDNTARKKNKGLILDGATPNLYKQWLKDIIIETRSNDALDDNILFINAWNEWAEGTYLEPDLKWKYGYLEATKNAIIEARENK